MISFVRRYIAPNFTLKILSLLLATGLWFGIRPDEQPAEVAVRAPIVFQKLPANLEISSETVPEAQIRVRGPERVIRRLQSTDVHAELALADAQPGDRTFNLTSQLVRHPPELSVVQVVPSQVHLAFDTRMIRDVEVHPRVTGIFMEGEQIAHVDVDPPRITITGPRHHVEKVEAATTDPVDASGTVNSTTFVTNVYVADPLVQVVKPTTVQVTVVMEKVGAATAH